MIFHFQIWCIHLLIERAFKASKFGCTVSMDDGVDIYLYGVNIAIRPKDILFRRAKIHALQPKYLVSALLPIILRKKKMLRVALAIISRVLRTIQFFKKKKK